MKNIKIILVLLSVFVLAFSLISCKKQFKTECRIMEINGSSYLVCDINDENALFYVPIEHIKSHREPIVDDILIITHSGGILETYPASFEKIYEIELKK